MKVTSLDLLALELIKRLIPYDTVTYANLGKIQITWIPKLYFKYHLSSPEKTFQFWLLSLSIAFV